MTVAAFFISVLFAMQLKSYLVTVCVVVCTACPGFAQVVDWADKTIPTKTGLVLWLDAQAIAASRVAEGLPAINDKGTLDRWSDASGRHRDFVQSDASMRPLLAKVANRWSVRFDGEDDHLRCVSVPETLRSATIFMVVAAHANPGDYRGLLSANRADHRDYESGFCIDLGRAPSRRFDNLNIEGRGFGGARDMLSDSHPFGILQTIEAVIDSEQKQVTAYLNGNQVGERPLKPAGVSLDQLTLAARLHTNSSGQQSLRGTLAADMAEVLVFDRVLSEPETDAVRSYLKIKHQRLADELPRVLQLPVEGSSIVKVVNPPPVHMLLPGFNVRELPLQLTNVNNVRYREDGRLMTLGYNGDLHLLTDTNGDGVEDRADLFWKNEGSIRGPIGLLVTPPNYPQGRGAFVASKGKISLIVDTNGDDKADQEIIVATGWKEIAQNVDAVGIAMDKAGALYFGLGTANYANAYQVDDQGNAAYDLNSERGTVQRISPDFSKRETICTGIRFPIAFGFNHEGDLFCTDQEGATWLANGNPLDELLHIQPGRHYGFPPRHPRHNPNVIDEPSVFDYGPQHQSTCGMVFNESVNGGPVFGPTSWTSDAIVCGESRGKLWRTKLIKTSSGYVAATELFACLQMLTIDACVAPNGDLVVACHSGPPDWGTGPTGIGKLFRIKMIDADAARPVVTWAESPNEIRVAFDRPLDPLKLKNAAEQVQVQYGDFVRAGDRFENLVPPYAAVQRQLQTPRYELPVAGVSLTSDLRTMIINTAAMNINVHYSVILPRESNDDLGNGEVANPLDQTEVGLALNGLQATWKTSAGEPAGGWSGWLPHAELPVARALTSGSRQHESLWASVEQTGELTLKTKVDLHHILRPAVQPGEAIDYEWPEETVTLTLTSPQPMSVTSSAAQLESASTDGINQTLLTVSGDASELLDLQVTLHKTDDTPLQLSIAVHTNEDARPRQLPLTRFLMPWIKSRTGDAASDITPIKIAEIEGGNWGRGRRVFHSEAASCFKCHAIGDNGAKTGPDLANLIHRDYASVLRDIVNPSFAINPDYIGHTILLESGQVLTGVLRNENGQLLLGDNLGNVTRIDRSKIEQMNPAHVSIMPAGLHEKLSADQLRDLMTYLLTPPPHMPIESPLVAPPIRSQAEVAAALAGSAEPSANPKLLNIVLVAGPKDHGPGEHDYPAWQVQWGQLLAAAPNVSVSAAWEFPDEEQISAADILIFFQKGAWDDARAKQIDKHLAGGGGAVYIHWAVNGDDRVADMSRRIGLASFGGAIKYRHGPLTLDLHSTDHPILRNLDSMKLYDESYWLLTGDVNNVTLLASSQEDGAAQPQVWSYEKGAGRVFVSIPGHYNWTFDDPLFRILLLRGIAWTAKEPVDRFNDLVPLGARMAK